MRRRLAGVAGTMLSACAAMFACAPPAQQPAGPLDCVNWVDPTTGTVTEDRSVAVEGGRLSAIVAASPSCDATVWAMPSLWDSHTHLFVPGTDVEAALHGLLAHGVTGIRDLGGSADMLHETRAALDENPDRAFDIVAAVTIIDGSPPVDPLFVAPVATEAELEAALDGLVDAGADFAKVYTLFPAALFDELVEAAGARGLPVAGHLPAGVDLERAVAAPMVSIEHLVEERGFLCDPLVDGACDAAVTTLVSGATAMTPTLVTTAWKAGDRGDPERLRRAETLVRMLHERGVPLLAGTDLGITPGAPGALLIDELDRLVDAGLSPASALRTATVEPRVRFGGMDEEAGWPGTEGDLVVTCSDPTAGLQTLREPLRVMSDGLVVFAGRPCSAR